jgi:hypothetical protein
MGISMTGAVIKRIQISQNSHFLLTEGGRPLFWLGDTAFELFHQFTLETAGLYFENRRKRGFNLRYPVALAQLDRLNAVITYGHVRLHELNPQKPNDLY